MNNLKTYNRKSFSLKKRIKQKDYKKFEDLASDINKFFTRNDDARINLVHVDCEKLIVKKIEILF